MSQRFRFAASAVLAAWFAVPALAHDMTYVGRSAAGKLKVYYDPETFPVEMQPSVFAEVDGWANADFGFEPITEAEWWNDFYPLSSASFIEFVLVSQDEGVQVLQDEFQGPLPVGGAYPIGNPYFHLHPMWNIHEPAFDREFSMTIILRDRNGIYADSDPIIYTFVAIPCPADFDRSAFVDSDDFDAFIMVFEAGC
jgi:hypothetical protein